MARSNTAQTVGENTFNGYLRSLDTDRIKRSPQSLKLNVSGRQAIKRVQTNNYGVLFTKHAYNKLGKPEPKTNTERIAINTVIRKQWKQWYEKYQHLYPVEVADLYKDFNSVSPRSIFIARKYWDVLGTYGHNAAHKYVSWVRDALKDRLAATYADFIRPMSVNVDTLFVSEAWLANVRTGSNSGYPMYAKQVKRNKTSEQEVSIFDDIAPKTRKLFQLYKDDATQIKWHKLPFSMGSRTERKLKARGIFMAPVYEKPTSAIFNYLVGEHVDTWMIHMPRREGSMDNLAKTMQRYKRTGDNFLAKDYSGFDTSFPPELFNIMFEILDDHDDDFSWLLKWEIDIIRNSGLIVAPDQLYDIKSLPSGVGPTQWIGTWVHDAYDYVSGLEFDWVTYQSDDTAGITNLDRKEVMNAFSFQAEHFGAEISPLGKKSFFGDMTIVLQMIVTDDANYGNEIRRFGNSYYRERPLNIKPELKEFFKDVTNDKSEIDMLGNAMS